MPRIHYQKNHGKIKELSEDLIKLTLEVLLGDLELRLELRDLPLIGLIGRIGGERGGRNLVLLSVLEAR